MRVGISWEGRSSWDARVSITALDTHHSHPKMGGREKGKHKGEDAEDRFCLTHNSVKLSHHRCNFSLLCAHSFCLF